MRDKPERNYQDQTAAKVAHLSVDDNVLHAKKL
jgi:hypothetical protein